LSYKWLLEFCAKFELSLSYFTFHCLKNISFSKTKRRLHVFVWCFCVEQTRKKLHFFFWCKTWAMNFKINIKYRWRDWKCTSNYCIISYCEVFDIVGDVGLWLRNNTLATMTSKIAYWYVSGLRISDHVI
jgi:hypothetical protein